MSAVNLQSDASFQASSGRSRFFADLLQKAVSVPWAGSFNISHCSAGVVLGQNDREVNSGIQISAEL